VTSAGTLSGWLAPWIARLPESAVDGVHRGAQGEGDAGRLRVEIEGHAALGVSFGCRGWRSRHGRRGRDHRGEEKGGGEDGRA
jgi:hypothetical protein